MQNLLADRLSLLIALALLWPLTGQTQSFDSGRASFELVLNEDLIVPYRVFAIYVTPGETVRFQVPASAAAEAAPVSATAATAAGGEFGRVSLAIWD